MKIRRWRVRQRQQVVESLWMYTPLKKPEARNIARLINFSPVVAARIIRQEIAPFDPERQQYPWRLLEALARG